MAPCKKFKRKRFSDLRSAYQYHMRAPDSPVAPAHREGDATRRARAARRQASRTASAAESKCASGAQSTRSAHVAMCTKPILSAARAFDCVNAGPVVSISCTLACLKLLVAFAEEFQQAIDACFGDLIVKLFLIVLSPPHAAKIDIVYFPAL